MKQLMRGALVATLMTSVALGVMSADAASSIAGAAQTPAKGSWTFLYYMDADNNLEADLLEDMGRMAAAGATGDIKVVALVDRDVADWTHTIGDTVVPDANLGSIPAFTDAKLVEVVNRDFKVLEERGEVDMGSGQTWAWFLTRGMTMYPAENYVAVINNHGGGIDGAAWDDGSDHSNLSMTEITEGVQAALTATKEDKFELIGFSACLMAHLDMAAKLAPYANYMLASEEVSMIRQWDDRAFIKTAIDNPDATGADLGQAVVSRMDEVADWYPERTFSTIDLSQMGRVTQALASFGTAVAGSLQESAAPLGRAQAATLRFGKSASTEGDLYSLYDVGDLVAHLDGVPPQVETAANALWEAERLAVVNHGAGPAAKNATGMAFYFPVKGSEYKTAYAKEAAVPEWVAALNALTGGAAVTGGDGGPEVATFELDVRPDGLVATATLVAGTGSAVTAATQFDGILQPDGTVHYLAVTPASLVFTEPVVASGTWNFLYAQITDGVTSLDSTIYLFPTVGNLYASVPMLYIRANGAQSQAQLIFVLDGTTGELLEPPNLYSNNGAGGAAALNPEPGSRIAPLVFVGQPAGTAALERISDQSLDATATLGVTGTRVATGATFVVVISVVDVKGNDGIGAGPGTVP